MEHHGVNKEQYLAWKKLIPYLYDWFANHNLTWPSLSCRYASCVQATRVGLGLDHQDSWPPHKFCPVRPLRTPCTDAGGGHLELQCPCAPT